MNKTTHFYVVPVTRGVNEKQLENFLRENHYRFSLPTALHRSVLDEFNKGEKSLGIIIEELMEEQDNE